MIGEEAWNGVFFGPDMGWDINDFIFLFSCEYTSMKHFSAFDTAIE